MSKKQQKSLLRKIDSDQNHIPFKGHGVFRKVARPALREKAKANTLDAYATAHTRLDVNYPKSMSASERKRLIRMGIIQ